MLGAVPELTADIPGVLVDAVESRQFDAGVAEVRQLAAQGRLGPVVVVHLGTNGPFDAAQFDQMMQALAPASHVLWLTVHEPRYWEGEVNQVIAAGVVRWSAEATLLDWHAIGVAHPEYFYTDGIHLEPVGAAAYARDVAGSV